MFKISRSLFILLLYWGVGFVLTHIPIDNQGEPAFRNFDKVAHFGLYAGLSCLMAFWLGTRSSRFKAALVATFICALYGLADEGIQYFIPSRNASIEDYAADVLGAIFGSICYLILDKLLPKSDARKPVDSPVK